MIRSTINQLEEFKKSTIWLDILAELEIYLGNVHLMLENQGAKLAHPDLDRLGGSAEAIHYLEAIPDTLIHNVEVEQKERELEEETE